MHLCPLLLQELPPTWPEFKDLVRRWFPAGVYDTKHLSGGWAAIRGWQLAVQPLLGLAWDGWHWERGCMAHARHNVHCH